MSKELRPCPLCGGPATHSVQLRELSPRALELIRCGWCGLELRDVVGGGNDLEDVWNTRSVTDELLKDCVLVLKMAPELFRQAGMAASTESGLLEKIEAHLEDAP